MRPAWVRWGRTPNTISAPRLTLDANVSDVMTSMMMRSTSLKVWARSLTCQGASMSSKWSGSLSTARVRRRDTLDNIASIQITI